MGHSIIKNPRRIFAQGYDPTLPDRLALLENNEYRIFYYEPIASGTSGTVTIPSGATIILDQFEGEVDAFVSTIENSNVTGKLPATSGGIVVDVSSFDGSGNWSLTGTPSEYPVALVYVLRINAANYHNLNLDYIVHDEEIKLILVRSISITSSAAPTPNSDTTDQYNITALATDPTFGAPTGSPSNGQKLIIRVKDNGTARTLGFNAAYRFSTDLTAPTTTVINKTLYMGFIYNSVDAKWDCVAMLNNF